MKDDLTILNEELNDLVVITKSLIPMGRTMLDTHAIYTFDLYCGSVLNRAINLADGFAKQVLDNNFISAAPLVRIHLDSLLRLFAAYQVDYNIDDFAKQVISGTQIDKLKDRHGQQMKDAYLAKQLSAKKGYNWVTTIYKTGSSHIHFSSQHIFDSVRAQDNSWKIEGIIKRGDSFVAVSEKIWATRAMIQITIGIKDFISTWIEYKKGLSQLCGQDER